MGRESGPDCERQYPMINEELKSDGFKPPHRGSDDAEERLQGRGGGRRRPYHGLGEVLQGATRTTSGPWFTRPSTRAGLPAARAIQAGWWRGSPTTSASSNTSRGSRPIDAKRAHYDGSYRVTAAFLAYLTAKYDKQIVRKLNKTMREGEYKEEAFKTLTGKTVEELDKEWRATLRD